MTETKEEAQRMYRIAIELRDKGTIPALWYRVWKLRKDGFTFLAIRNMLRSEYIASLEARTPSEWDEPEKEYDEGRIQGWHATTLGRWYEKVQAKIEKAEDLRKEGRHRIAVTVERNGEVESLVDTVLREVLR